MYKHSSNLRKIYMEKILLFMLCIVSGFNLLHAYKYKNSLSNSIKSSYESLELETRFKKINTIINSNPDSKKDLIISDLESKIVLRDLENMTKTVKNFNSHYDINHKNYVTSSYRYFLLSLFSFILALLYTVYEFIKQSLLQTKNKSSKKMNKNLKEILTKASFEKSSFQATSSLETDLPNNSDDPLTIQAIIENFINNKLVNNPKKNISIESISPAQINGQANYSIKHLTDLPIDVNYHAISPFLTILKNKFSDLNLDAKLSRNVQSTELKFELNINKLKDLANAQTC